MPPPNDPPKVAILGAGASGLVTARYLLHAHKFFPGIHPTQIKIFEASPKIGGTFQLRVYESAELVSSKYLTTFSDFRLPLNTPDFITPARYCQYLTDYATHHEIIPHISFSTTVTSVTQCPTGGHLITSHPSDSPQKVVSETFDAVVVSTGMHTNPEIPKFPGVDSVPVVLHSSQVKTREQLGDGNVLVLGAGETGLDMAHLAVTSRAKRVVLGTRNGFFCGPKIIPKPIILNGLLFKEDPIPNKPVDCSVASLFDTAYVPPILQRSRLMWEYYNLWIKASQTMISGTPNGPDQWAGIMDSKRNHVDSVFFVKTPYALDYISNGKRSKSLLNRIRSFFINVPIRDVGNRRIETSPWPRELTKKGIIWDKPPEDKNLEGYKPDVAVFATGYRREIPWLKEEEYGSPTTADVRGIWKSRDISVAFIGFQRPSLGAIPPLAEMQAQLWVYRYLQSLYPSIIPATFPSNLAPYNISYELHRRSGYDFATLKGGVDHECYVYQLALDAGSAPTFSYIWQLNQRRKTCWYDYRIVWTWAMGANFNTKFRLVGPWRDEEMAAKIMEGELWGVVRRSGGFVYLMSYTIIPFCLFGFLSLTISAVEAVWGIVYKMLRGSRGGVVWEYMLMCGTRNWQASDRDKP